MITILNDKFLKKNDDTIKGVSRTYEDVIEKKASKMNDDAIGGVLKLRLISRNQIVKQYF